MPLEENKTEDTTQENTPTTEPVVFETPTPPEEKLPEKTIVIIEPTKAGPISPEEVPETEVKSVPEEPKPTAQTEPEIKPEVSKTPPETLKIPINELNFVQNLLVKARAKIQERKRQKLNKIMAELEERGKITNDEIEKLLRVSDSTATRYMDILESEGKIRQVGKTGRHVFYEKIG